MEFVHPKDLKIGDIVQYVSYESWIDSNCSDTYPHKGKISKLYRVDKIIKTNYSNGHISRLDGANNPILTEIDNPLNTNLSAWWGSWILIKREESKQNKEFGIAEWCRKNYV